LLSSTLSHAEQVQPRAVHPPLLPTLNVLASGEHMAPT
jgi:hypothetical protein